MANDFDKELENGVDEEVLLDTKIARLNELKEKAIMSLEEKKEIERLEKEIRDIESRISSKQVENGVVGDRQEVSVTDREKEEEIKSVQGKSVEEIKNEVKEEKNEREDNEPDIEDGSTEKAYEDAMQKLHEYRIAVYNSQIKEGKVVRLTSTKEQFMEELKLEKEKAAIKIKYIAELDGKENKLQAKEEALAQEERKAKEPIQREIRERSRKYAKAMLELHKVNLELAYIHKLMREQKISQEDYQSRKEIALKKQKDLKDEIAKLNPKELMEAMEEENLRKDERARVLGEDFERQEYEQSSIEEQKSIDYRNKQEKKVEKNLEFAEKEKIKNPEVDIEESKSHIEQLKKELEDLPDDDIKRRMEILKEMEEENIRLEINEKKMDRIERGETLTPEEELRENKRDSKIIEETVAQNIEDYRETEEAIEMIEKEEGRRVVSNPDEAEIKKEEKEDAIITGAVVGAAIMGDEHDTVEDDIIQAGAGAYIAKQVVEDQEEFKGNDFEKMLNKSTYGPITTKEDADRVLKQDKEIEEAKRELAKNEKQVLRDVDV